MLRLSVFTHLHKMLNLITPQCIARRHFIQIKVKFIKWHVFEWILIFWPHFMFRYAEKCFIFYYYNSCRSLKSNMKAIVNRKRPRRLCILSFKMQYHSLKKFIILHPRMYKAFVNFAENELNFLYFACLRAVIKQSYDSNIFMTKEPLFINGI